VSAYSFELVAATFTELSIARSPFPSFSGTFVTLTDKLQSAGAYPFQDDDPFVMRNCPHLFFVGNQPRFGTKVITGGTDGQTVRLVAVPSFSATGEIVLVDTETLDVSRVRIMGA